MYFRKAIIGCSVVLFALGCGGGGTEVEIEAPTSPEARQAMEQMNQAQQEIIQRQKEIMERSGAMIPKSGQNAPPPAQ